MPNQAGDKVYLTDNQLRARYGKRSVMWLPRKRKKDPRFPKPTKMGGRLNLTALEEIVTYERIIIAEERAATPVVEQAAKSERQRIAALRASAKHAG